MIVVADVAAVAVAAVAVVAAVVAAVAAAVVAACLLYTSPSPRDLARSRMPSSA